MSNEHNPTNRREIRNQQTHSTDTPFYEYPGQNTKHKYIARNQTFNGICE